MKNTRRFVREIALVAALAVVVFSPAGLVAQGPPAGLPDLVGMLKATPGCLGVDAARTSSGKQVIFAWFENKKAVLNWYNSDMHRGVVEQFSGGHHRPGGPLAGVPDEGPVLAVASITMGTPAPDGDVRSAIRQIAIELYSPLPGG